MESSDLMVRVIVEFLPYVAIGILLGVLAGWRACARRKREVDLWRDGWLTGQRMAEDISIKEKEP